MGIALETEWPLWLLAVLPLLAWLAWRNRAAHGRRRTALALTLRSAAFACIVLALAMPSVRFANRAVSVVYALDVSASMDPAFVDHALAWIEAANAGHPTAHVAYVAFAGRAELVPGMAGLRAAALRARAGAQSAASTRSGGTDLEPRETDLERAAATALAGFSPDAARRLVLISDGGQTRGDVWRELPSCAAST